MKLSQIQEARYAGEHPFFSEFFKDFFDADALSRTDVPNDVTTQDVIDALNNRFGQWYLNPKDEDLIQWQTELPENLKKKYDMNMVVIEFYPSRHRIDIMWE